MEGVQATAAAPGSPAAPCGAAGEVTEAALAARQEQGVASFAEFYAAVLLGILVERDALLRQARAQGVCRARRTCQIPWQGLRLNHPCLT